MGGRGFTLPDGLLPLGLADLGFLVPLRHNLSQGGASNGPLELHCTAGALLRDFFLFKKTRHYFALIVTCKDEIHLISTI